MTLQKWLEARSFTLSLSSGFFGFYAHAGFMKALEENGLAPQKLTGASAGAIVAAASASGLRAKDIQELVLRVKLGDFWDPAVGLGFVRGKKFEKLLEENVGRDFSVAKKPLDIATFNIRKRETEIFTAGALARVVRASSAVPLMFHPVNIAGRLYWDGGITDKMALKNVGPQETVLGHYLQSTDKYELYERGRDQRKWTAPDVRENRQVVILKNLARSGPKKMHLGPEILEAAYKQTLERLRSEIS